VLASASPEFLIEARRRHTRVEPASGLGQLVSNDLLQFGALVHDLPSVDEEGGDASEAHAGGEVDVGVDCGPVGCSVERRLHRLRLEPQRARLLDQAVRFEQR